MNLFQVAHQSCTQTIEFKNLRKMISSGLTSEKFTSFFIRPTKIIHISRLNVSPFDYLHSVAAPAKLNSKIRSRCG